MKDIPLEFLNYISDRMLEGNILNIANINTHYKVSVNTEFSIIIKSGKMVVFNNKSKEPIKSDDSRVKTANITNFKFMMRYIRCLSGGQK